MSPVPLNEEFTTTSTGSDRREIADADWLVSVRSAQSTRDWYALILANEALGQDERYCLSPAGELSIQRDSPRFRFAADGRDDDEPELGIITAAQPNGAGDTPTLLSLCTRTGWPCNERSEGRIAVELDFEGRSAIVEPTTTGIEAHADLLTLVVGETDQPCFDAIGLLLLRLAGCVRMVQPEARLSEDHVEIRLTVAMSPDQAELHLPHALAALTVALGLSRAECLALVDPEIARLYLMTT